ncbi:phosphoadenosine phosphosulfate reductase domain-containing protein [Streptomyces albidoflavus]
MTPKPPAQTPQDRVHVHRRQSFDRKHLSVDVYTLACERTAYILDNHDRAQIMFSGGKDSTAVINVALEVAHSDPRFARHLPLRTIFFDEEAIPQETADYVSRMFARPDIAGEWYCLPVQHRNACSRTSPYWWPWAPEAEDKWCRPMPDGAITHVPGFQTWPQEARMSIPDMAGLLAPPPHTTASLMGIRAQESITRLRAVTKKAVDNYIIQASGRTARGNLYKTYPVYDWKTEDVWAAPKAFGWDYNHAYDLMEMAGVGPSIQRCSPAFGEEPLQKIHTYAQCFPEVWAKMSERVPGIGAAQRYALTELYAYKDRPDKPAGMPWPDFISHYLKKFRPKEAAAIAERIQKEVASHYRRTTNPIVYKAIHPMTGLTWHFLLTIAMRGDFKGRKQAGARCAGKDPAKLWQDYTAEVAAIRDAGTAREYGYPRSWPTDPSALVVDIVQKKK